MKDIKDLKVTQIRIFPVGTIPYSILCVPTKLSKLKDVFHFGSQEIPFPLQDPNTPNVLVFLSGEVKINERDLVIDKLSFEGRKITVDVVGDSTDADSAFKEISKVINELTGRDDLKEENCLVKSQETKCLVNLDINFWDIFNQKIDTFIKKDVSPNLRSPLISIEPKKLAFEIMFRQREELEKEKIALSPKPLIIEPNEATPLEKRIFHTHTPFDSDIHFQVIKAFEDAFSSPPKLTKRGKKE
jgi:hypothetical protein